MHEATVTVLSSGSCGNSIVFSSDGASVMVDAGLSCKELERRMSLFGLDPSDLDALLLTHEHTDHTRGAKRLCSTYDVPVYGTDGTLSLTPLDGVELRPISHRHAFEVGPLRVSPFPIKHLAAEPVAFSISDDGFKLSIVSDLGCVTPKVVDALQSSTVLMVEANYDDDMLVNGTYPDFLKRTIRGDHGHLSNDDAAALCSQVVSDSTTTVVLLHLSRENNTPEKAAEAVAGGIRRSGRVARLEVTEHGGSKGPVALR
jgi:phosphoribosyl 1,2-cyclic phosphodiesterase